MMLAKREITFAKEPFAAAYREASELLAMHYEEIAPYRDLFKINCNIAAYEKLEQAGTLQVVTARHDGRLVGYFLFLVARHPHYNDTVVANEDMKFLHPDYRGGTGFRLIAFAENLARQLGCKVIFQRSKAKSEHGPMYRRMGYELMDEIYAKRLDTEPPNGN
jgi:GNAT superfamily N-acetyltransferase